MPSLWFCVPVHGRLPLASICLRQLRRTCDALNAEGVYASSVIVASQDDHDELPDLGFAGVIRDNESTSRRFNDGIQLATDPVYNSHPADFVVPLGSDDWVDHRLFLPPLPGPTEVFGFKRMSFVREDGQEMVTVTIGYQGGSGIRIIPRQLLEPLGYRPADEDRQRGCDTSILSNLYQHHPEVTVRDNWYLHDRQIVDWKTPSVQLNSFESVARLHRGRDAVDPFVALRGVYPDEALEEMAAYYECVAAASLLVEASA